MKHLNACRLSVVLATALAFPLAALADNPAFPGADPHVAVLAGKYWAYPTHTPDARAQFHAFDIVAYSSKDLIDWEATEPVLKIEDISWIKDDGARDHWLWAPGITEKDGKYYLYYSVGPQNPTPSRIGVAVSDTPDGTFKDSGKPLLTGGDGFEAIDPMVFHDKDGASYFYAGGSAGAKLRVWKLKPNMVELGEEIEVDTPPNFTEGAFMHEIDGTYYLSYSHGGWNNPNYSVHYATSDSPTGPWEYQGAILNSRGEFQGTGHHLFFQHPQTGQWYIAYHYWPTTKTEPPLEGVRQCAIQQVAFGPDGKIEKIVPTKGGPAAALLQ